MPPDGGTMKRRIFGRCLPACRMRAVLSSCRWAYVQIILGAAAFGIFSIALPIGNQLVTIGYFNMRTFQVSDVLEKSAWGLLCVQADHHGCHGSCRCDLDRSRRGYRGEKMAAIVLMIGFRMCESVSDLLEGRYQQKNRYDVSCRRRYL